MCSKTFYNTTLGVGDLNHQSVVPTDIHSLSTSPSSHSLTRTHANATPHTQAVVLVGQPFDTIKVRQQVLQQRTLIVLRNCLRQEGLVGLYKGVL